MIIVWAAVCLLALPALATSHAATHAPADSPLGPPGPPVFSTAGPLSIAAVLRTIVPSTAIPGATLPGAALPGAAVPGAASPDATSTTITSTTSTTAPAPPDYDGLVARLQLLTEQAGGRWGVYVYETDGGREFGLRMDEVFDAASTSKLPLFFYVCRAVERGEIDLNSTLTYRSADYQEGSGSIQECVPGTRFTIEETLARLIKESDNVAKNMLYRLVGRANVRGYTRSLGATSIDLSWANDTTPREMGLLLRLLYERQIVGEQLTAWMLNLMTGTLYEARLPRYLTRVPVAHKVGMYGDSVSDVGIVLSEHPYIICVYSEGSGGREECEESIAQVSRLVYRFETARH